MTPNNDSLAALEQLIVLRERRNWLAARIKAKESVGWETQWDQREHDALKWAVEKLERNHEWNQIA